MSKQILFDDQARAELLAGANRLCRTVSVTLGPSGRNVILDKSFGGPSVTKDGVTVAKEIELEDPFQAMGAKLVKEVAQKTNDQSGDGTTSATVLATEILAQGMRHMASGVTPSSLKSGIDKATAAAVSHLAELSEPVSGKERIAQVATVSANHDTAIGELLAEAVEKAGEKGVITVEENQGIETELDYVDGMSFDKGYISPYFVTDAGKMTAEYDDALVLVYEKKISALQDFLPLLEQIARTGKPLFIVAEEIDGEALAALVVNRLRGIMKVVAVKAPGFGDRRKAMLGDIATLCGGQAITEDLGLTLEQVTLEHLGRIGKVTVDKDKTVLVGGTGEREAIDARVRQIEAQIERSTSEYDKEKLNERLAKLAGGVAVIKVGAQTEAEMKEKKARVDDALHATRAAVEEGVVCGGGVALLRCIEAIEAVDYSEEESAGATIIANALRAPARTIADNAGFDGALVVEEVLEAGGNAGFDALRGEHVDMFDCGILDPTKVVRSGLQNAASIAGLLLTTNTLVTEYASGDDAPVSPEGAIH